MENPIRALEDIPQHFRDWVAKEIKKAQVEVKLEVLELLDFANSNAAEEIKSEIETLNSDLKNL